MLCLKLGKWNIFLFSYLGFVVPAFICVSLMGCLCKSLHHFEFNLCEGFVYGPMGGIVGNDRNVELTSIMEKGIQSRRKTKVPYST